jgi:putative hydrolase of the HAD superfamily
MANWPEVAEIEGVTQALEMLSGKVNMVVATNAAESSAEQVRAALDRVHIGKYFKAIFTVHELGEPKPSLGFFQALESVLAVSPRSMVMIGDDYQNDILGAQAAGWRTVWFNSLCQAAPALLPLHDREISQMAALPLALQRPPLPSYAICLRWMIERGTPHNILAHVHLVAAIAYQLAIWLNCKGEAVDPLLCQRGALLHDLAKIDSIGKENGRTDLGDHGEMAFRYLTKLGQPELAEIAFRHMPYRDPLDPRRPITWEQRLTHYADKLAEGSSLVSINERLNALKGRYPSAAAELEESWPRLKEIEQDLCSRLELSSDELYLRLRQALRGR